jgi:hypothetical protein
MFREIHHHEGYVIKPIFFCRFRESSGGCQTYISTSHTEKSKLNTYKSYVQFFLIVLIKISKSLQHHNYSFICGALNKRRELFIFFYS